MARVPSLPQFYMGRGVDGASGKAYATAIDYSGPSPVGTGQVAILRLESITSSRELTERLEVDAHASLAMPKWGLSAEFKLTNSRAINNYYTYALVRVVVENPPEFVRAPRLKPEAAALLAERGWEGFSALYGWEYVEGVITGGSYYALIEIQTENQTTQKDVKTKLSGFYGPFKADASLTLALKDIAKTTTMNVLVMQSGGTGDPLEVTLETMVEQARTFPQVARATPVQIAVVTNDYATSVPLPPRIPAPDALPRLRQRDTLVDLGREYLRLRDYAANARFVLDHLPEFDEYREFDGAALAAKRRQFTTSLAAAGKERDRIVGLAERCAESYKLCATFVPKVQSLELPTIKGQLMQLKQMEDKLVALEQELAQLRGGSRPVRHLRVSASPQGETDRNSNMMWIESSKDEPPYVSLAHSRNGAPPTRYGYVHVGDFGDRKEFALVADNGAQMAFHAPTVVVNAELRLRPGGVVTSAGRMHITGGELLYLLNKDGVIVSKAWEGSGDLTVEGNLGTHGDLVVDGNLGTHGFPATPKNPAWGGGIHTFDVEAEGSIWCGNKMYAKEFKSRGGDLAENYASADHLAPADVVCLDPCSDGIVRSTGPDETLVFGVVSTEPGVVLNARESDESRQEYPIALCGRVPCKVVGENGPIRRGDLLSTSSTPGHAMKAPSASVGVGGGVAYRPGTIVGKALGSFDGAVGVIEVFVCAG